MRHFLLDLDLVDCILVHIFLMFWDISYTTIHHTRNVPSIFRFWEIQGMFERSS